jgi:hypothetical protein
MKDGHIAESGTHEELLKNGAEYAKLYNIQARAFIPEVILPLHTQLSSNNTDNLAGKSRVALAV